MNSKVYMKLKQKVKSIWNNLVYGIDPHLIESIASFRSINNVTQRTELCAGTGVLVHGTFAAIYRLGRQTYGGTAAPPRCTGVQAAGQMYVEYAGCANQRPTWIESGNPFSSATTRPSFMQNCSCIVFRWCYENWVCHLNLFRLGSNRETPFPGLDTYCCF